MATPLKALSKKKQPAATKTSSSIDEQVKAFLESGGSIEHIKTGVSGQQSLQGPKQINIESKPKSD